MNPNVGSLFLSFQVFFLQRAIQLRIASVSHEQSAKVAGHFRAEPSEPSFHESSDHSRGNGLQLLISKAPIPDL